MATVDDVTGNGPVVAETSIINTLQLVERICTRNERVDNVRGSGARDDDTAGKNDTRASEIKRELG